MKKEPGNETQCQSAHKTKMEIPYPILGIFVLSGAAGLMYEIVWSRYLHHVFGISIYAVAVVVAVYMAGLALGSAVLGKRADRMQNPLRFYALLEFSVAIYALLVPWLLKLVEATYIFFGRQTGINSLTSILIRLLGAMAVLLIPTFLMGGTLPFMVRACVRDRNRLGEGTGILYAMNTLGAMIGCFITGFVLIRWIGLWRSSMVAVVFNLLAAGVTWYLSGKYASPPPVKKSEQKAGRTPFTGMERLVLWAYGFSGLAALTYEVLWIRALKHIFGTTTYAFTTVLTAFLTGIGLGSLFLARYADDSKDPLKSFGVIQILIGISALFCVPLIRHINTLSMVFLKVFHNTSWWGTQMSEFFIVLTIMLVPTLLMGATLPVVMRIFAGKSDEPGSRVGTAYAFNTVGAIIGSLGAGFVMIPLFGIRYSLSLMVYINILTGCTVLFFHPSRSRVLRMTGVAILVGTIPLVTIMADQRPMVMSKDLFRFGAFKMLFSSEKADGTLAVVENTQSPTGAIRGLFVDGNMTAANEYQDMQIHDLLSHLGLILHPDPHNALIVGFGLGVTPFGATQYDNVKVDCVELMREETQTAPYFAKDNHNVLKSGKLHLIIGDGRDYIKVATKKYDMISFNAVHPVISPALYTVEFYKSCRRILSNDGIIIGWITSSSMNEKEYKGLIKSFIEVFPHTSLWYVNPSHMILMGMPKPLKIDMKQFMERISLPKVKKHLAEHFLDQPCVFLNYFVADEDALREYVADAVPVTDDNLLVEFTRNLGLEFNPDVFHSILRLKSPVAPYLTDFEGAHLDKEVFLKRLDKFYRASREVVKGQGEAWMKKNAEALKYFNKALEIAPEDRNARHLRWLVRMNLQQMPIF